MAIKCNDIEEITWEEFIDEFQDESDRACAIMGGEFLNNKLESVLRTIFDGQSSFIDGLFEDRNGAVSSFYSRIQMTRALKIIDDEQKRNIDTIRQIRNAFAHKLKLRSFEGSQELVDKINRLSIIEEFRKQNRGVEGALSDVRFRFMTAVFLLGNKIEQFINNTKPKEVT